MEELTNDGCSLDYILTLTGFQFALVPVVANLTAMIWSQILREGKAGQGDIEKSMVNIRVAATV